MATPYAFHHVSQTGSTQDDARRLFAGRPVLVQADRQLEGRGRRGRRWDNAPRAVAASLAWKPAWPQHRWPVVALVAGLAARAAIAEHTGIELGIKWPNDLVSEEGKVAGLLVEAEDRAVVAGLGVNLWWPDPPESYAGLLEAEPGEGLAVGISQRWAEWLLTRTALPEGTWGREEFEAHCVTLGRVVGWKPQGRGKAVAVAEDGALVVETADGRIRLLIGEVHEVR